MKFIYFGYYRFYRSVLKDNEPHLLTTLALSASIWFVLQFLVRLVFINQTCNSPEKLWVLLILLVIVLFNYIYFHRSGLARKIVDERPMIFGNRVLGNLAVLLFFLITLSFMFWGPIVTKELLEGCRTHI